MQVHNENTHSSMYDVERDIPVYSVERGIPIGVHSKYPFLAMSVGDSFFVPDCDKNEKQSVRYAIKSQTRSGEMYTTRSTDGGFRVWRIR